MVGPPLTTIGRLNPAAAIQENAEGLSRLIWVKLECRDDYQKAYVISVWRGPGSCHGGLQPDTPGSRGTAAGLGRDRAEGHQTGRAHY